MWVGGFKYQNAYGCLRCQRWVGLKIKNAYGCLRYHGWVGLKIQMLKDPYDVVDGGFEIFKRVLIFIQPKSEPPIFEN